uniref:Uncharacterized protein n=1 Tax=Tanacetum cinerariifolium TaxID=118510 RepID=A0A6L2MJY2_TANCI|nr:hypothetical protein [Tanacetum cinerariifolium]
MPASHADLLHATSTSRRSPFNPRRWPATKLLSGRLTSSSRAVAGAGEAISEGITSKTNGDSRDHFSDAVVPINDGAGEALTDECTRGLSHSMFL